MSRTLSFPNCPVGLLLGLDPLRLGGSAALLECLVFYCCYRVLFGGGRDG